MGKMDAKEIKERVRNLGGDLCGIGGVERFSDAPEGFHPTDILPDCRSVIVIAGRFPASGLDSSSAYTFIRNRVMNNVDAVSFQLMLDLDNAGGRAVAIPSSEPYEYWDESRRHGQGILSLKHAAVRAGLGKMGKNTLLIHERLGNMLWLGAVLTELPLESDPLAQYQSCLPDCRLCLEICPVQALDGISIEQRKCRAVSGKYSEGGGGYYACNLCRKVCPQRAGVKS